MKRTLFAILLCVAGLQAQQPSTSDPLQPLVFLEGTWGAHAHGDTGATVDGAYTFARELGGHVLARHDISSNCKGPSDYDCGHKDLLYVYSDAPGQRLKAIFFDNEGHVIHYGVSIPNPTTAVFLSDDSGGPRFRLTYTLKDGVMTGKFEMLMPGQSEWRGYLEWSGGRREK